ncbi:serine hydrolase [Geodermatophilus normandii]|uniref:serine hydrolase n=1 Tax=Geodermatophilus normandii TaxID=1137989 RepID=UPI0014740AE9|nr:serine hydrolase [Geodermatophilus normandii]
MSVVRPRSRRPRRGPLARVVAAALTVVLASVLVVTATGLLAVLVVRGDGSGGTRGGTADAVAVTGLRPFGTPRESSPAVPAPSAPAPPVDATALLAAVAAAAAAARGTIDVAVLDAAGRPLVTGASAGAARYTASLVKLLVVGRLLALDAAGALDLGDRDLALMERAIVRSDDGATSILWDRYDGATLVAGAAAEAGLTATAPPAVAGRWGEATTSASDVAVVLAGLAAASGEPPAATLLGWLRATTATAADGFDQTFGLLRGTAGVAAKQGWMCCVDGRRQVHSAGVLPDGRVVVLLGDFPTATSWGRARGALDDAAAAVLAVLS